MGVVELELGVIAQRDSSSTTAVQTKSSDAKGARAPGRLTLRIRSAASGDTESGMRRSTLQILRYVAARDIRCDRGVGNKSSHHVDHSGLQRVVFRPKIQRSRHQGPNSRPSRNVPSPRSFLGVDSPMCRTWFSSYSRAHGRSIQSHRF